MIVNQDWRKLVEVQIAAHWEDACRRIECCLSGAEARFLEEHGTESLRNGFKKSAEAKLDRIARSELPTYEVIEESLERVVVEVTASQRWPQGLGIPLQTTRIHLIPSEAGWQVADIFQRMHSLQPFRSSGRPIIGHKR